MSEEILNYLEATAHRPTRDDLKLAIKEIPSPKIAIDCGCGAGSDIAFLRQHGFTVHAFDIEKAAIARCCERFANDNEVILTQSSFSAFSYPQASLVVADASLFFCPPADFPSVWKKIQTALIPGGVFTGSFLGAEDTMASEDYDRDAFWPEVMVTDEKQVKEWFANFELLSFKEHKQSGTAPGGLPHRWHIYSVVGRKTA